MPIENETDDHDDKGEDEGKQKPEGSEKKDPHLAKAIRDRDAAKQKAREYEAKIREYEAKEAEAETAREAAAAADEKQRNDVEAQLKRVEKERDKERSEKEAALAQLAARAKGDRESALVEAVAGKAGLSRTVVKGLLRVAAETGFDNAPETFDDDSVADAIKKLGELEPDLIKPRSSGSAGKPGVNLKNKGAGEDPTSDAKKAAAIAAAQAVSPGRPRKKD